MYGKNKTENRLSFYKRIIAVMVATVLLFSVSSARLFVSATGSGTPAIAPGGTISSTSTTIDVAGMFDNTATADDTDSITVTGSGSAFTVTLKNDLTLNGMITIDSGVTLTILSAGNYTITRGATCTTHLFNTTSGHLVLGSGNITNNTITYNFNNGDPVTHDVGGTVPTSTATTYVTHTVLNAVVESTMNGTTLTIDGGAASVLDAYTGTSYSHDTSGNTSNNRNLIQCVSGTVTMWGGVTMENNLFAGNDTYGGGAVNLNEGIMYMYGGTIRRCVNVCSNGNESSSLGDGGAMFLQGASARLYMYGGTITECESDNSSAISLWNSASLYLMGGSINRNFAVGDTEFPAQAISAYNGARMYIYDGLISGNHGINDIADIRISTRGSNDLHFFGGIVGFIVANNNKNNMLYVYAGSAESITPSGQAQLIRYTGNMRSVSLPNAVQGDGGQIVRVTIYDGSVISGAYNLTGSGTNGSFNPNLLLDLSVGEHTVEIKSISMTKTYYVTVAETSHSMTSSIIMTTPVLFTKAVNTITLSAAGTGNSVDGTMYYGCSTVIDTQPTTWQESPTFSVSEGVGLYYLYVKVVSDEHPDGSVCTTPLIVMMPLIQIPENILLSPGGTGTVIPTINPVDCPLTGIIWTITGATIDTTIRGSSNYGKVTLSATEPINNSTDITIHADLYGRTADAKLLVAAGCSHSSAVSSNATLVAGETLTWSMAGYDDCTYQWQQLNGTVWENIANKTTEAYTAEVGDIGIIIRLSVTYNGDSYYSPQLTVVMNNPTFTVTIPDSITPSSTTGYFNITATRNAFALSQSITVKCSGDFKMKLTNATGITLGYTLYTDSELTNEVDSGDTVATLTGTGTDTVPVYYTIVQPVYAGTYTDTLTFTVTFSP